MTKKEFAPVTPGEMLKEEFLAEYGLSQNQLAKAIGISPNRITEIVNNRRRITADTALRLSLYFGNSPELSCSGRTRSMRSRMASVTAVVKLSPVYLGFPNLERGRVSGKAYLDSKGLRM